MSFNLIDANDSRAWRTALDVFSKVDVCHLPEYHSAYSTRTKGSRPVMWRFEDGGHSFCYPFLLTPVVLGGDDSGYKDVSSIYGYSGPLSTSHDGDFLHAAWKAFDAWCAENRVIAEFVRFSIYAGTVAFAHKGTDILPNRPSAVSLLPADEASLLAALPSKTRNMIRKATKSELSARELEIPASIPDFRKLYEATMDRNDAPDFFNYDDRYFELLMSLPAGELRLFGVFHGARMIAAAMALVHGKGSLYHLGASLSDYSNLGAGNLAMFEMHKGLMKSGVEFLHVGGGRTTAEDDPLYRFKKNNATNTDTFQIGKRVVDTSGYQDVTRRYMALHKTDTISSNLQFYR